MSSFVFRLFLATTMAAREVNGRGDRFVDANGNDVENMDNNGNVGGGHMMVEEGEHDPNTLILVSIAPYGEQVLMNLVRQFFKFFFFFCYSN